MSVWTIYQNLSLSTRRNCFPGLSGPFVLESLFCLYEISRSVADADVELAGTIVVGASGDEASAALSADAKSTMLNDVGVDLMSLTYRAKFVFVAQVGSPQKVVMELRDNSPPAGLDMHTLIAGWSVKTTLRCSDLL